MARFEKLQTSNIFYLRNSECYLVKGSLTREDVTLFNSITRKIVLILNNTKGQNSNILRLLDPDRISFSVLGGINYLHKTKYNNEDYVESTMYSPINLSNIINIFETIESRIKEEWTTIQKSMYVYKTLVENLYYTDTPLTVKENGLNIYGSLNALIYNKGNDFGLSLTFKEAMDRLGIECYFQSKAYNSSWNAIKIDDSTYIVDMAQDVLNRSSDGTCGFLHFGRETSSDFYEDENHDISKDNEEILVSAIKYDVNKMVKDYDAINKKISIYSKPMKNYSNSKKESFYYMFIGETEGLSTYIIRQKNDIDYYYLNKDLDIKEYLDKDTLETASKFYSHNISKERLSSEVKRFNKYIRDDGTVFLLFETKHKLKSNVREFYLIEADEDNKQPILKRTKILSETPLLDIYDKEEKAYIADVFLSPERLRLKTMNSNGYVGYISKNFSQLHNKK
jgi:hypothetical protein